MSCYADHRQRLHCSCAMFVIYARQLFDSIEPISFSSSSPLHPVQAAFCEVQFSHSLIHRTESHTQTHAHTECDQIRAQTVLFTCRWTTIDRLTDNRNIYRFHFVFASHFLSLLDFSLSLSLACILGAFKSDFWWTVVASLLPIILCVQQEAEWKAIFLVVFFYGSFISLNRIRAYNALEIDGRSTLLFSTVDK